jgi:hypothetical protein
MNACTSKMEALSFLLEEDPEEVMFRELATARHREETA